MSSADPIRLFLGVPFVDSAAGTMEIALKHHLLEGDWRPMPRANWHITVLFMGHHATSALPGLVERASGILTITSAFELHGGRFCTVSGAGGMRWLRFEANHAFTALHRQLASALQVSPDMRVPQWPHVTLARGDREAEDRLENDIILPRYLVDRVHLFRSDPGDGSPVYTSLAEFPLRLLT